MTGVYYHVTPVENLSAILDEGLTPQLGERSEEFGEPEPAIHLYVTPAMLEDACMNAIGDMFDEDVALALIEVSLDGPGPDDEFDWAVHEAIPSASLRVLSHDLMGETSIRRLTARA